VEKIGVEQSESLLFDIEMYAFDLGFDLCHFAPVEEALHADFFSAWVGAGRHGEMDYLARNVEKRRHPGLLAPPGEPPYRTMIVLAVDHHQIDLPPELRNDPSRGLIASYAWGDDYHDIIRPLLHELDAFIRRRTGRTTLAKCLVDTGPVLERDWALRTGLGFTGKNCCTIHPRLGSWLLLATILVPESLVEGARNPDPPSMGISPTEVLAGLQRNGAYGVWPIALTSAAPVDRVHATCGRCTRCLDACPTGAFVGPYHLNPATCISYWTIETQSPIPCHLRPLFGNRIFGCDICQEVCPYNRRLATRRPLIARLVAQTDRMAPPLLDGFGPEFPYWLDDDAFARRFRHSPIKRAKRYGMLRNVCVALGNWADPQAIPALTTALGDVHREARGHAAWALGQVFRRHGTLQTRELLLARLGIEVDDWVREEIACALDVSDRIIDL
jgi:epoxyqueuosine reductase